MFGNNPGYRSSPSVLFQAQSAGLGRVRMDEASIERRLEERRRLDDFVSTSVKTMISDLDILKATLNTAIDAYLQAIQDKLFRSTGRYRAGELKATIQKSENILQVFSALGEAIKSGNEDEDSLKRFLFDHINKDFFDNKILQRYPYSFTTLRSILESVIVEVKRQLNEVKVTEVSSIQAGPR